MNSTEKSKQADSTAPQDGSERVLIQDVTKTYFSNGQALQALNGVSLKVHAGEFVALVGRSGCGKSTLLNLAGAMDFPTSGRVLVDGVATSDLNDSQLTKVRREKLGFIFQSFQLLHTLSVLENVELPLQLAGEAETQERAREQLDLVGIGQLGTRMVHQLSGGQMQRVAVARAMVHRPKLLLADEPTGNLDTATGNAILELLRRIATQQRTAILLATHSPEAAGLADAVVTLRDGRIHDVAHERCS